LYGENNERKQERERLIMKRKKVTGKMEEEPGEKNEIKEQAVIMKGNKKRQESKVIYMHAIKTDGEWRCGYTCSNSTPDRVNGQVHTPVAYLHFKSSQYSLSRKMGVPQSGLEFLTGDKYFLVSGIAPRGFCRLVLYAILARKKQGAEKIKSAFTGS
jgi:hypothetical protein